MIFVYYIFTGNIPFNLYLSLRLILNADWSGGSLLFYLGAYSMMADISKQSNSGSATTRLAILDGLWNGGYVLGNALAGPVKVSLGLKYNFALGLLFTVIVAAYTLLFIKETLVKENKIDIPVSNDGMNISLT